MRRTARLEGSSCQGDSANKFSPLLQLLAVKVKIATTIVFVLGVLRKLIVVLIPPGRGELGRCRWSLLWVLNQAKQKPSAKRTTWLLFRVRRISIALPKTSAIDRFEADDRYELTACTQLLKLLVAAENTCNC
jgi:hypothetical protein